MENLLKNTIKIKKNSKFGVNPAIFLILLWLIFNFGFIIFFSYLTAIVLHELGHYFMAKAFGYSLSKFSLSPYGVSLSYYGEELEERDDIFIALAGPLTNIVCSLLCLALWWIFPVSYIFLSPFVEVSLVIALFNLLPAYPLDGGRIFVSFCAKFMERKRAIKLTMIFNILFAFFFFIIFIVLCFINFNPTYLLFAVFLILGLLDLNFLSKYEKISAFNKSFKNFSKPRIYIIDENVTLKAMLRRVRKNRTCLFILIKENGKSILLSDEAILKISLKTDINAKISDLFRKSVNK